MVVVNSSKKVLGQEKCMGLWVKCRMCEGEIVGCLKVLKRL